MKLLKEVLDWIYHIMFAFVLALIMIVFFVQPTHVEGQSMEPTLNHGDKILVSKLTHTFGTELNHGDIVVVDSRIERERNFKDDILDALKNNLVSNKILKISQDHTFWIKRVIAKAGDEIEYKENKLFLNGTAIEEPYIKELMEYFPPGKLVVPADHIFVMGDNRNKSSDSRYIGFIPVDHVMGKLAFRF